MIDDKWYFLEFLKEHFEDRYEEKFLYNFFCLRSNKMTIIRQFLKEKMRFMPGEKEGNDETERVEEKLANPKEKNSVNLE